ncbi:MAG: LysM peptidoglycan-binding domain-containing protein [Parachlamydiaceae bacterium]
MSKRDAIIISVLVNAGLLAILFITAIKSDPEQFAMDTDYEKTFHEENAPIAMVEKNKAVIVEEAPLIVTSPLDEVDKVLQDYLPQSKTKADVVRVEEPSRAFKPQDRSEKFIEITVKRGDALEKIARTHGTSVEALRKANRLTTDKLKIGQVLRIPQASKTQTAKEPTKVEPVESTLNKQYYTVKSGDNPWKIAKQFNVKFDDLLDLNHLDEEKARNLKVGDRIRVK